MGATALGVAGLALWFSMRTTGSPLAHTMSLWAQGVRRKVELEPWEIQDKIARLMAVLPYSPPRAAEVGGSIRVRAQVPLLASTAGLEAEAAHVEMPQLPTGGVHRLMSLLLDRSFTGLENPVAVA